VLAGAVRGGGGVERKRLAIGDEEREGFERRAGGRGYKGKKKAQRVRNSCCSSTL
jgi:hypothetical protein